MELDSIKKYQLSIGIVFIVACIVYFIIVFVFNIDTEVMSDRFDNANDVFNGQIPDTEYPPFALVFMVIPRIFASTPYWYNVGFVIELFVFFMIGLIAICKIAEKMEKNQKKFMLAYTILMLLLFEFVVDRYDIIPAALALLSVYCFMTKRYTWAFILISIGAMTKLYPALLFPIYLIPFLVDRDWKNAVKGTAVFAITSLAILIPAMLIQPDILSYFIGYHEGRPLQIESVAASLIYPFVMLGLVSAEISHGSGSDNLVGPFPDAVASWLTPLMVLSVLLVYVVYACMLNKFRREGKGNNDERLFLFGSVILLSITLFIVVGKVFSAQYLIWVIPPLLCMFMSMGDHKLKKLMFTLMIISLVLTQAEFAYNVGYLGGGAGIDDIGMMIILARNIVVLVLLYYIIRAAYLRLSVDVNAEQNNFNEDACS